MSYYVFSSDPLGYIGELELDEAGVIERIWKKGTVLLPKNEVSDVMRFGATDIPDYPRVLYCPKIKKI